MEQGVRKLKEECEVEEQDVKGQGERVGDHIQIKIESETENEKKSDSKESVDKENDTATREHLDSVKSESTVKSEHSRDADLDVQAENESSELTKSKRKRRRKRKNKYKVESSANNQALTGENEFINDDIFDMDDFSSDEELCRLTANMANGAMSKSISLPVVEENRFDRTNEWASAHEGFAYLNSHPFSDTDLSPLGR